MLTRYNDFQESGCRGDTPQHNEDYMKTLQLTLLNGESGKMFF